MNNGLDKLNSYDGTVYRGVSLKDDAVKKYLDAYENGTEITENAYTSTSSDPTKAFDGNVTFAIQSKNGKMVKDFSEYDSEEEVLFKNGSRFKVTDVIEYDDGVYSIKMEEL